MLRIVHTGCGAIEGIAAPEPEITVFRGIPFAAPPVGDLRWRAPQPVAAWAGTLAAHDFAPACPQPTPGDSNEFYDREWGTDPAIALDEDTRVSGSPAAGDGVDSRRRLPDRMHRREGIRRLCPGAPWRGGGFRRLPAQWFGFLAHNRLREEAEARHDDEPYANFGFLDQRAGIRWVVKNIAAFGGDPENITIFGQSAGAGSVLAQICSPLNRGLFQRAIMQSGAGLGMFNRHQQSLEDGHRTAERLFEALGVSSLDEARQVPAAELLAAAEALPVPPESGREGDWSMMVNWVPCVDGRFITDQYARTIARGEQNEVEILLGNTTGEFMETDADGHPAARGRGRQPQTDCRVDPQRPQGAVLLPVRRGHARGRRRRVPLLGVVVLVRYVGHLLAAVRRMTLRPVTPDGRLLDELRRHRRPERSRRGRHAAAGMDTVRPVRRRRHAAGSADPYDPRLEHERRT